MKESGRVLVLGDGPNFYNIMDITSNVLFKRVHGRNYLSLRLKKWVQEVWGQVLNELPAVCTMSSG